MRWPIYWPDMPEPATPPAFNPALYLRPAFECLHWPSHTFDAAMQDPARRAIIEFIATCWPQRPMENVVPISRICQLATGAARHHATAREANPYPEHSAAGGLYAQCFDLEKARMTAAAAATQPAGETA